ncbi:glycine cleavage system protein GcvH [Hydrogenophaga palleronii]|uniref:glycine cleavage system protein GcvH n=1 Tax=Hydrogenophaga palleronii TaxID=65655 RepID=UPI000825B4F0
MIRFTDEHVWVTLDGGIATAGITAHAQDTLGEIVSVELPSVGARFEAGAAAGVVESIKTASDVHMPLAGEILELNEALVNDPSLANSDPLGAAWFFRFRPDEPAAIESLMDEATYTALTR